MNIVRFVMFLLYCSSMKGMEEREHPQQSTIRQVRTIQEISNDLKVLFGSKLPSLFTDKIDAFAEYELARANIESVIDNLPPQSEEQYQLEQEDKKYKQYQRTLLQLMDQYLRDAEKLKASTSVLNSPQFYYRDGYYFIRSTDLKGKRLRKLENIDIGALEAVDRMLQLATPYSTEEHNLKQERDAILNLMVQDYKIHLMPKSKQQLFSLIDTLLKEIANNTALQNNIVTMKIRSPFDFYNEPSKERIAQKLQSGKKKYIMPIVVLYPKSGKASAQLVLDEIYRLFGKEPGLDIAPRFNEKVTDLIYFAQGEGKEKGPEYAQYYEAPDQVYYKYPEGKTDYHLQNPAKK